MLQDGFLGNQTSFMLDVVVVALVVVAPLLVFSLFLAKVQRRFGAHRNLQLFLAVVLLVAVAAFEVDLHLVQKGWQNVVAKRTQPLTKEQLATVHTLLRVHLVFAASTPFLWALTLIQALRKFPNPPQPGPHSSQHKVLGWISAVDLILTSVTGLIFYYAAFVAKY